MNEKMENLQLELEEKLNEAQTAAEEARVAAE